MNADKPTLYPEMNANIVGILRTSDSPASHYAAALIESLQAQLTELRGLFPICDGCDGKTAEGVRTELCEYETGQDKCMERAFAYGREHKRLQEENAALQAQLAESRERERAAREAVCYCCQQTGMRAHLEQPCKDCKWCGPGEGAGE